MPTVLPAPTTSAKFVNDPLAVTFPPDAVAIFHDFLRAQIGKPYDMAAIAEMADGFLDAEHIRAHDLAGAFLARGRFESAVLNQPDDFRGQVIVFGVNDFLGQIVIEAGGFQFQ